MAKYDAIFIGAGNSNLVCALKLAKSGKKVLVLERNGLPGGCATSFTRGRFEFDASLQEVWEYGAKEDPGFLYKTMESLGLMDRIHFSESPETFAIYESKTQKKYILPFGIRNFIDKMEEYVPGSRESVETFFKLAIECRQALNYIDKRRDNMRAEVFTTEYSHFMKIANESVETVLHDINMPKEAINIITSVWLLLGSPVNNLAFSSFASMFYAFINYGIKIPKKTSHMVSMTLAEELQAHGGQIEYFNEVESIIIKNKKAHGVKTKDKSFYEANKIICEISPNIVYGTMIDAKWVPKDAIKLTNSRILGAKGFTIYLGLNQEAKAIGLDEYLYFIYNSLDSKSEYEQMKTAHNNICRVSVINNIHNSCSPKGTCILEFNSFFVGDNFWQNVTAENYVKWKETIARQMIDHFELSTGIDLMPYIEEIEIATPLTYAYRTNHPDGAIFGYKLTGLDNELPRVLCEKKENYIDNLHFIGNFGIQLFGYPSAYLSGNELARKILEEEKGDILHE